VCGRSTALAVPLPYVLIKAREIMSAD